MGSSTGNEANVSHDLAPKARVKQMQNRMCYLADVLVNRKPILYLAGIERSIGVVRIAIRVIEIPRGVDERVHGIRFTARRTTALRTRGVLQTPEWKRAAIRPCR